MQSPNSYIDSATPKILLPTSLKMIAASAMALKKRQGGIFEGGKGDSSGRDSTPPERKPLSRSGGQGTHVPLRSTAPLKGSFPPAKVPPSKVPLVKSPR